MSPELLLREPWRLSLFFVAVFGTLILCLGVILWQQAGMNRDVRRSQNLILLALQKSDRNNRTIQASIEATRKTYESGRKTRGRLIALVAEEKRLNLAILQMNAENTRMNRQQLKMGREIVRLLRKRR